MGIIWGYASIFNNRDSTNDIVIKGAFKQTLYNYKQLKLNIPVLWSHDNNQAIGKILAIKEDKIGLKCKMQLFKDGPRYKEIVRFLQENMQLGLSIGYRVINVTIEEEHTRFINKCNLVEISICLQPANPLSLITKWRI